MIRMTKYTMFFLAAILLSLNTFAQPGFGKAEKINDNWRFHLGNIDDKAALEDNGKSWKNVQLPHDWSIKQSLSPTLASATGYLPGGLGWYQKQVNIAKEDQGKKFFIYFEGVYNRSEVFINGKSVGKRPNGYISFAYEITPFLKFGQENKIQVKVDHTQDADSRWYTGSGIYRDVWLVKANPVHLAQWGVYAFATIQGATGNLKVRTTLNNELPTAAKVTVINELLNQNGAVVAKKEAKANLTGQSNLELSVDLKVNQPKMWSIDEPTLYTLRTTVLQNGKTIDQTSTTTGFRDILFNPDHGMTLNGKALKIKGVCLHHDSGVLGSEVYPEVWQRRLQTLKGLGVNAIRTSHNPQASSLYALCDELGILVLNEAFDEWEFAKRKWLQGWNVGTPGFQGSFDYFKQWGERDLADMVKRDRNHLSIFAWSIGNEVDYPNDPYSHPILAGAKEGGFTQPIFGGYKKDAPNAMHLGVIAKKLVAVVKKYDPNRPVTAGLAGVAMSNETEYPGALDIAGYNYTESRYQTDHQRYPKRVLFGSENRHDFEAWKAVRDNEHIFGQFLWTGIDYLGESGRWPARGFYSGLVDFAGFVKPRGYFRQSLWSNKPMAYLGTYPLKDGGNAQDAWSLLESGQGAKKDVAPSMDAWPIWNYQEGQQIRVVCYTNAKKARLELNGKQIGETKPYDDKYGIIYWDIPYAAGSLEAVGLDENDKEFIRHQLQTSKNPHAIKILQGPEMKVKGNNAVAQIEIQIVDENGVGVELSDNEITCQIVGKARLLGMESGNNSDMGDYTDNRQRVFHGKMIVYVQATGKAEDEALVRFTSPWLNKADVKLKVF